VRHLPEVLEGGLHLNDEVQDIGILADFVEEANTSLANLQGRVVDLRQEQSQGPRGWTSASADDIAQVVGRKKADGLMRTQALYSAEVGIIPRRLR
jgi:hypothetical protein